MAANAKYTQAPTQDPDEHDYPQAPPAYQAESSNAIHDDEARLFGGGAPRASQDDDDIPDDFKVCRRRCRTHHPSLLSI